MNEELFYQRVATKAKDGADGVLYLHKWATGYQFLIFGSASVADAYLKNTK